MTTQTLSYNYTNSIGSNAWTDIALKIKNIHIDLRTNTNYKKQITSIHSPIYYIKSLSGCDSAKRQHQLYEIFSTLLYLLTHIHNNDFPSTCKSPQRRGIEGTDKLAPKRKKLKQRTFHLKVHRSEHQVLQRRN